MKYFHICRKMVILLEMVENSPRKKIEQERDSGKKVHIFFGDIDRNRGCSLFNVKHSTELNKLKRSNLLEIVSFTTN